MIPKQLLLRLRAWWRNRPCWTECYPPGWRSVAGIGMPCEDCDALWLAHYEEIDRERAQAARLLTRPEYV